MVTENAARPADRERLHLSVAEDLENRILSGNLPIGDRLPSESAIARDFNVSTRSVREAMQILETKGLVRRKHGERAMIVRDDVAEFLGTLATTVRQLFSSNPDYLVQLMEVRRMIEVEVIGALVARDNPITPEIDAAMTNLRNTANAGEFGKFTDCDAAFHRALVQSAGNDVMAVLYNNLYGLITDVIRVTSRVPIKSLDIACAEHEHLYDLIKNRDEAAAKQAIAAHINNSSAYLQVAIAKAQNKDTQE
mgnify:FL=1|tara:strand:- start:105492 stop:106244 length:753 start_codon:yes stop_codon:yes gene_type:complete